MDTPGNTIEQIINNQDDDTNSFKESPDCTISPIISSNVQESNVDDPKSETGFNELSLDTFTENNNVPIIDSPNQLNESQPSQNSAIEDKTIDETKQEESTISADTLDEEENKNKVFIGGLPPSSNVDMVKKVLEPFGTIKDIKLLYDKYHNTCKGYGFVTFLDNEGYSKALDAGSVLIDEKEVSIKRHTNEQKEKKIEENKLKLHVSNLDITLKEEDLKKELGRYTKIKSVTIIRNDMGVSRGYGFVELVDAQGVSDLLNSKTIKIAGRFVILNAIKPQKHHSMKQSMNHNNYPHNIHPMGPPSTPNSYNYNPRNNSSNSIGKYNSHYSHEQEGNRFRNSRPYMIISI
ncbi:hypothetical protein WA158_004330 [Blastocystis sp. Blastoise]